jgi:hypothetical protein
LKKLELKDDRNEGWRDRKKVVGLFDKLPIFVVRFARIRKRFQDFGKIIAVGNGVKVFAQFPPQVEGRGFCGQVDVASEFFIKDDLQTVHRLVEAGPGTAGLSDSFGEGFDPAEVTAEASDDEGCLAQPCGAQDYDFCFVDSHGIAEGSELRAKSSFLYLL